MSFYYSLFLTCLENSRKTWVYVDLWQWCPLCVSLSPVYSCSVFIIKASFLNTCLSPHLNLLSPNLTNGDKVCHHCPSTNWRPLSYLQKLVEYDLNVKIPLYNPLYNLSPDILIHHIFNRSYAFNSIWNGAPRPFF